MSLLAIAGTAAPSNSQEAALYLGILAGSLLTLLTLFWIALQIIGWFRPKDSYATKSEVAEVRLELYSRTGGIEAKFETLRASIQTGFTDLHHAIGVLEGKADV